ncbi:MAG: alkaline phosphatase [Clostridiales bacterium]|jgi:alkaline phosphatase|nr:alkaline phosphatase [Clostridiales bacterium]
MKENKTNIVKNKRKIIWTIIASVLFAVFLTGGAFMFIRITNYGVRPDIDENAQNVILLIGDGMGRRHVELGYFFGYDAVKSMDYHGTVATRSVNFEPTDSAAAATAIASGTKVLNQSLNYDIFGRALTNIGELSKNAGKKYGVAVTKNVTDATPAGFTAHNKNRADERGIALEQIRISRADVIFGLGRTYFEPYKDEIITSDRDYCVTYEELRASEKPSAIAVFDVDRIPEEGEFTLASIAMEAIRMLENPNGFFLMVEGSKIDTYSHSNDMENMLRELRAFNAAVAVVLAYAAVTPNTTVIVTADHETGGLRLPANLAPDLINDSLFTTGNHTAADVDIFISGPGAASLVSQKIYKIDNTDIFYIIRQLLDI